MGRCLTSRWCSRCASECRGRGFQSRFNGRAAPFDDLPPRWGHSQVEVFSIAKHGDAAAQTVAIAKRRHQLKKVMRVRDGSETNMNSKGAA